MAAKVPVQPPTNPAAKDAHSAGQTVWLVALLSVLWRVPSWFDPPWVNDEGTYFAVGQAISHGFRLYADIWENKPPAMYLVYAAVSHRFGTSLLAVRLLASIAVVCTVVLTMVLARAYVGRTALLQAGVLAGLLLSVPFLEGTTANAEVFLAPLTASAVYFSVVRKELLVGGVLLGCAVLFKAVGAFDGAAIAVWVVMAQRQEIWRYLAGVLVPLGVTLVVTQATGTFTGLVRDALLYDFGYIGHGNGAHVPWLLGIKLGVLTLFTWRVRRGPFPVLWLGYAAAGALVSGRFFGHYALQAVVPTCLCVALAWERRRGTGNLAVLPLVFFTLGGISAGTGWAAAASGHDSILARRLQYYANFVRYAIGAESPHAYREQVDDHVERNLRIVDMLQGLSAGTLLVWGNTPWVYPLSDRLPATSYTSSLRQPEVPGETSALRTAIRHRAASVIVVIEPAEPPLGDAKTWLRTWYTAVGRVDNAVIYRVRR